MGNVLQFVKNNKIAILLIVILLVLTIIGICVLYNNKIKEYSLTEVSDYKYYVLNKGEKYGVIDIHGNVIVEPEFDNVKIPNPQEAIFACENKNETIILNDKRERLFTQYDEISVILLNGVVSNIPYEKTVLKYKKDGKYGIVNFWGKEITKPVYDEIIGLENKESELLVKKDGKYGVINVKGAKLIDILYDNIVADGFFTDSEKYGLSGYIVSNKTSEGYKYGYIDYKHKLLLKLEYDKLDRITKENSEDICIIACKNGQYGIVKNNQIIVNYYYQGIEYDRTNNFFELQRNDKYGIVDYNGKVIISTEYDEIQIRGIYIQTLKNEKEIFFNMFGEEIQDLKYTSIQKTQNDDYFITINEEGFYGVINNKNIELIKNKYNYIEYLFDKYFIVAKENGDLGVIDINDEIVIDFKYDVLQKVDGTKVVEAKELKENKLELYSFNMEKICSQKGAFTYKESNYIKVYSEDITKYFDINGKELDNKEVFIQNTLLASKKGSKWGFTDRSEKMIVDYQYDKVTEFNMYGYAGIMNNGKWGVIDINGNIVQEPIYELEQTNSEPEFLGKYYKVYYGYGECYYTNKIAD